MLKSRLNFGELIMDKITAIKGIKDILPEHTPTWNHVESIARQVFGVFGFREIRVPIMEKTELFKRSIGETTDIVEKEMYTFRDRDEELLTLRPEATASVIRAYIEHNMMAADPITKLFTFGPMFRRERPQKGRFRQFHQIERLGQRCHWYSPRRSSTLHGLYPPHPVQNHPRATTQPGRLASGYNWFGREQGRGSLMPCRHRARETD